MTIASCYVSTEGVVFGADSTTTYNGLSVPRHYNHAQKVFEIGERATFACLTWGLGGLGDMSYRRIAALLADDLVQNPPANVQEVAERWSRMVWAQYSTLPDVQEWRRLNALPPFDPTGQVQNARTDIEEKTYQLLENHLFAGFCIGGYVPSDRAPQAYTVMVAPSFPDPIVAPVQQGWSFWGAPNIIKRLIFGIDDGLQAAILNSPHWTGTAADFDALAVPHQFYHPTNVPMRDAIDFVHSCISSTIKAMKFSASAPICGGPIEIAVITADRPFRWVQHKPWDTAIHELTV